MKKLYATLFSALFLGGAICASCTDKKDASAEEVINTIHKVNNYWQTNHPEHGRSFWDNAAYHTGNMEAYFLTKQPEYLEYSKAWAEYNEWKGAKSDHKENWKYSYGESDDYVLFGDYQICFQTYADLYNMEPDTQKIARAREVMEYQMSTPNHDYWWWADGLYMVMPVMTKMYNITKNPLYLEKLYNPQIQISAESETKRSIFREKDKTKRSKKESAQHSKSRNKSFVMTSVSAL